MGITRKMKATALTITILLLGLAAAACGGDNGGGSGSSNGLVPQRANVVGSVDVDQFLDMIGADLEQLFDLAASDTIGGPESFEEFLEIDPTSIVGIFRDVDRADIFAEADDIEGESEYFGVVLHGSFDEPALIVIFEAIAGGGLAREAYKGNDIYSLPGEAEETAMSVLDSETFAVGSAGAVKDIIDLRNGDAESASGPLIDVFNDLSGGIFALAAKVPQDSFDGQDLGSIPGLGDLPISLDFLASLDIVGVRGDSKDGSLKLAISMDFTDEEAAETLEGFIKGIVTLASGFSPDPRTTELLSSMEVEQEGSRLTVTVAIPESELSSILGDLTTITDTTTATQSGSRPPGTPEIRLLESAVGEEIVIMPSSSHAAEGQAVEYSTTPPTSGIHWGRWADCGWYTDGLPDEVITHNLEHGNIVVSYNFTNPALVSDLREILDGVGHFQEWGVARSYGKIPDGQLALSAWGRLATFQASSRRLAPDGPGPREIERFFESFAGLLGPERVAC